MTVTAARAIRVSVFAIVSIGLAAGTAFAQNWSFDARSIALGGTKSTDNLATGMTDDRRQYKAIVLPFGLFQVLSNTDTFNPDSTAFDPIHAVESVASPLHYRFDRSPNAAEALFVSDLRNAQFANTRLSKYQGFVPANSLLGEGLLDPSVGYTVKFLQTPAKGFQGVYIGASPYVSFHADAAFDPGLTNVLATGVDVPNATFPITNHDQWQAGMAIVTGYRGRFPLGSATDAEAQHNGLFVAANVRYLLGLWFNRDDLQVELRTDAASVVVPSSNVTILEQTARGGVAGSGVALDFGVEAVHDRWEIGVGANGVGNRITWRNVTQETHTQASLTSGDSDFETGETTTIGDVRVTLPTDVRAHVKYFAEGWSLAVGGGHGFGGGSFHSGVEKRTGRFELRGGFRYMFSHWNPSGGLGVDLSRRVSFDVAVFGSNTNVELKRQASVAFSVRLNHKS